MMGAVSSSETSNNICQIIWSNIPEVTSVVQWLVCLPLDPRVVVSIPAEVMDF
jgi:hypothetical protein